MQFDTTINLGHILASAGIVFGFLAAWYTVKSDIRSLDARVLRIEDTVHSQISVNAKLMAEISAMRQDVAVIRDRLEPPPVSAQSPSKGSYS